MGGVLQSGNVTPGHIATWATDGVIADGGPVPFAQRTLASLLSADFNSISDQAIVLPSTFNKFQLTGILVTNASLSLTTAHGGFYPQAAKGGTAIVSSSQVYSSLTTSLLLLNTTLSSYGSTNAFSRTQLPDWAIYFSLTAAQGTACSADIYVLGVPLA